MTQAVDLVIDRRVLLDIGIGRGNIRFRLIVVIVRHEIFYRIFGKEFAQLGAQLRRERFVVCQHECRTLNILNNIRHRKGFS